MYHAYTGDIFYGTYRFKICTGAGKLYRSENTLLPKKTRQDTRGVHVSYFPNVVFFLAKGAPRQKYGASEKYRTYGGYRSVKI